MSQSKLNVKIIEHTPNPEKVIAMAGKLCYSPSNIDELQDNLTEENAKKFVNMLISMGHESPTEHVTFTFAVEGISRACYDKETEVYTSNGWKYFKDLKDKDKPLTISSNGKVEFQDIKNKTEYLYNGEMHKYKSQNVDLLVTPNHNILMRKFDVRKPSKFKLIPSGQININRFYMKKGFIFHNDGIDDNILIPGYYYERKNNQGKTYTKNSGDLILNRKNFFKLLAWYLGEGSTYYDKKNNSYTISICQTKYSPENILKRTEIYNLITSLGFTPRADDNKIQFKNLTLGKLFHNLGISYQKYIPFDIFKEFNKELSKEFIDTYIKGDGTKESNGHERMFTTSKILADQLQMMCFLSGYTSSICIDNRVGQSHIYKNQVITHNKICYVISISKDRRNFQPVIKRDKHFSKVKYNDYVYCVEVPNHTLLIRRNGIIIWCGNCTHQLVRHRIASYSQKSQRYVKEGQFEYIIPKEIENNNIAKKLFVISMEDAQYYYDRIVEELLIQYVDDYFTKNEIKIDNEFVDKVNICKQSYKKQYREFEKKAIENARYVLPNACETKIILTMNIRSLMNFFQHRCCVRAQDEIRQLANEMLKQCREVAPTLFKYAGASCIMNGTCPEGKMSCGKVATTEEVLKLAKENNMKVVGR